MPHRVRKVRKQRGSRTHGWGQVTQHRKGGSRGGYGKTGGHKHRWTYTVKYTPDRYGKKGFNNPTRVAYNSINIGELDEAVGRLLDTGIAVKDEEGIIIDLSKIGIDKLLGSGRVDTPLIIKVEFCSQQASRKIEEAGGKILRTV